MRDIPAITKNLLIINVLMFLGDMVFARLGIDFGDIFGLHFFLASDFHIYQLVTYMFMHGGWTHIFFNMFALWMFGRIVEATWGPKRFLFYYLSCGIGAGLIQEVAQFFSFYALAADQIPGFGLGDVAQVAANSSAVLNAWTTVGASGAIYGILLAFGMLYPEERLFVFPLPVPIKAKWFVAIYAVIELLSGLGTSGDGVAHFAHLGGMLFGYLIIRHWNSQRSRGSYGYGYGPAGSGGPDVFAKMKSFWEKHTSEKNRNTYSGGSTTGGGSQYGNADWDYNARQKHDQEEIDRILDKIRKSGYDSLTAEEKRKLFDSGKQ